MELAYNRGFKEHELTRIRMLVLAWVANFSKDGMNSLAIDVLPSIIDVKVERELLIMHLDDGRILSVPLSWYPRLQHTSNLERTNWELFADGKAVEWPDVDEHIGIDDNRRIPNDPPYENLR